MDGEDGGGGKRDEMTGRARLARDGKVMQLRFVVETQSPVAQVFQGCVSRKVLDIRDSPDSGENETLLFFFKNV